MLTVGAFATKRCRKERSRAQQNFRDVQRGSVVPSVLGVGAVLKGKGWVCGTRLLSQFVLSLTCCRTH